LKRIPVDKAHGEQTMNITISPLTAALPVSLADAKAYLRVDYADDDAVLLALLGAATATIESQAGLAILPADVSVTLGAWDGARLPLPVRPMLAGALTVAAGGAPVAAAALTGLRPSITADDVPEGEVVVTYRAGWPDAASVPADIKLGIMDQAAMAYDNRGVADNRSARIAPAAAIAIARYKGVSA
jgi:uncharacterized phiE125 gp8 family phage protein